MDVSVNDVFEQLWGIGPILALLLGTIAGLLIGTLPGLGAAAGIGILLPLTFFLSPMEALLFYVSLYQASEYGGSISALSVSVPGTPNAAVSIFDGYTMAQRGFPGLAFAYSLWSVVGASLVTIVAIIFLAPYLASTAVALGSSGFVMLALFGLATVGAISGRDPIKGIIAVAVGLLLSMVGLDTITGQPRFTFGRFELYEGMPIVPIFIGLFAIPQVMRLLFGDTSGQAIPKSSRSFRVWLPWRKFRKEWRSFSLGTTVGSVMGLVPGLSGVIDSFISYNLAKVTSKHPERFGTGTPEGIVAPESTGGAVTHSTLMPAFLLGIPGTPTSAIILGAMLIGGLQPGPSFLSDQGPIFYSLFVGLFFSTIMLWLFGILTTSLWARVAFISPTRLGAGVLVLCIVGTYASRTSVFDVGLMFAAGLVGYGMVRLNYPIPALVMGLVVGTIFETNLRRSLALTDGSFLALLDRPVNVVLFVMALGTLALGIFGMGGKLREPVELGHGPSESDVPKREGEPTRPPAE